MGNDLLYGEINITGKYMFILMCKYDRKSLSCVGTSTTTMIKMIMTMMRIMVIITETPLLTSGCMTCSVLAEIHTL